MDPKKIHEMEQAMAAHTELAGKLGGYFLALRESGFTRGEAMQMVLNYQQTLILTLSNKAEES